MPAETSVAWAIDSRAGMVDAAAVEMIKDGTASSNGTAWIETEKMDC